MLTLALAVLLSFTDPPADLGNGAVRQPTAAVGRPNGALDVTQFDLFDSEALTFSLTFTSLANPFQLPNGFTFPIIEVYVDDQSGTGSEALLPGSGMRLPGGATWNYAFKLTGETLQVFQANANGWQDVTTKYPTRISVQGTSVIVSSSVPRPEKLDLYGMVGSYTGFNETGWTPLSRSESPWAYSSETQIPAALDIIAPTFEAQQNALATGVLPVIRPPRPTNPWIFVMIGGVLLAILGVMLRFAPGRTRTPAPTYTPTPTPSVHTDESKPKTAHPGPYQPEPLKSRSNALKHRVSDTPLPSPEITATAETEPMTPDLTPGQLMAAERARAMILSDRKLRDSGETPIVNLTEPIQLDSATSELDSAALEEDTKPVALNTNTQPQQEDDEAIVSSAAIPLFETPKTTPLASPPLPSAPQISPSKPARDQAKKQFAASEVWHEEEEELSFLWDEREDIPEVKRLESEKQQPKKQPPETNS